MGCQRSGLLGTTVAGQRCSACSRLATVPGASPPTPCALAPAPSPGADQILRVAKALAHTAKFRSALVNGGTDMGSQKEQLERPLDVLVGTPQRVMQHAGGCWRALPAGLKASGGCWQASSGVVNGLLAAACVHVRSLAACRWVLAAVGGRSMQARKAKVGGLGRRRLCVRKHQAAPCCLCTGHDSAPRLVSAPSRCLAVQKGPKCTTVMWRWWSWMRRTPCLTAASGPR